jgi:hypothetical protein
MSRSLPFVLLLAAVAGTGCDTEEIMGHGTPVGAQFVVGGAAAAAGITISPGQTIRIEVEFVDGNGDHLNDLEDGHYASLTFSPPSLATVALVTGEPFAFDVTAQLTAGSGFVEVGYGHSPAANESEFGPYTVSVQ